MLTLGFFTPLPLGCSSESCRFLGLFSTGGVSAKLESWGSGVAFSPKGSDYRRENSRNVSRWELCQTAVLCSGYSQKPEAWNAGKEPYVGSTPACYTTATRGELPTSDSLTFRKAMLTLPHHWHYDTSVL